MGLFDRAWRAIGTTLATILVDSTGTALGTSTNPLRFRRTLGLGTRHYAMQTGILAASAEVSAFTGATLGGIVAGKAVEIISLEIVVTHDANLRIKLLPRASVTAGSGQPTVNVAPTDGSAYTPMTIASIRQHGHPLFELLVDSPSNGVSGAGLYKLALRPGVRFPFGNGGDLTVVNLSSTTAYNVITNVIVEELIP